MGGENDRGYTDNEVSNLFIHKICGQCQFSSVSGVSGMEMGERHWIKRWLVSEVVSGPGGQRRQLGEPSD